MPPTKRKNYPGYLVRLETFSRWHDLFSLIFVKTLMAWICECLFDLQK